MLCVPCLNTTTSWNSKNWTRPNIGRYPIYLLYIICLSQPIKDSEGYIHIYKSIVFLPDCLANTEFTVEMTFLLPRRLALLDLSVVHVEECFGLLQRTRLFLSLQQSHLNVIYGDSWRFIQFTIFAPKRCTALGTYFPLSISSLATSKSPDSSACKSKAREKLKASWNIVNLKISKTQSNQSHTILTLKSGCDITGSPRSLLAVDAVGHRCQQVRHKLEPRQRRFSAVQGIQRQTKSMEQSKSSKSSHLVLYWGYPRSEAKDGGINMFILLEKELGLCSTPDLMKTFHTANKFKELQDIEKKTQNQSGWEVRALSLSRVNPLFMEEESPDTSRTYVADSIWVVEGMSQIWSAKQVALAMENARKAPRRQVALCWGFRCKTVPQIVPLWWSCPQYP